MNQQKIEWLLKCLKRWSLEDAEKFIEFGDSYVKGFISGRHSAYVMIAEMLEEAIEEK